jgi:hypothetical protein
MVSGATRKSAKRAAKRATAEDAHRVLAERVGHVAQPAALQVGLAVVRIDQPALVVLRDRVDGEVAPRQVLLQRDLGLGMEREAVVAARGLALGARQRVFLARLLDAGTPESPCRPAGSRW